MENFNKFHLHNQICAVKEYIICRRYERNLQFICDLIVHRFLLKDENGNVLVTEHLN